MLFQGQQQIVTNPHRLLINGDQYRSKKAMKNAVLFKRENSTNDQDAAKVEFGGGVINKALAPGITSNGGHFYNLAYMYCPQDTKPLPGNAGAYHEPREQMLIVKGACIHALTTTQSP